MHRYYLTLFVLIFFDLHSLLAQVAIQKTDLKGRPSALVEKEWFIMPGTLDTVLVSTTAQEFDEMGRVLSFSFFSQDLLGFKQVYRYEGDIWKYSGSYDSDGKLITEHTMFWKKAGLIDSIQVINHAEESHFTEVFTYDDSYRLILRQRFGTEGEILLQAKHSYTSPGKFPMVEATYESNGNLIYEYFFDENGNRIISNVFLEGKLMSTEEYFYEENRLVHFKTENELGETQIEVHYQFDSKGLLIKEETQIIGVPSTIKNSFYKVDALGNWVVRESRSNYNHTLTKREITYFSN